MIDETKLSWPEKCPICSGPFVIHPFTHSGRVCNDCMLGIHYHWTFSGGRKIEAKPGNFLFWHGPSNTAITRQIDGEEMTLDEFKRSLKLQAFR